MHGSVPCFRLKSTVEHEVGYPVAGKQGKRKEQCLLDTAPGSPGGVPFTLRNHHQHQVYWTLEGKVRLGYTPWSEAGAHRGKRKSDRKVDGTPRQHHRTMPTKLGRRCGDVTEDREGACRGKRRSDRKVEGILRQLR